MVVSSVSKKTRNVMLDNMLAIAKSKVLAKVFKFNIYSFIFAEIGFNSKLALLLLVIIV